MKRVILCWFLTGLVLALFFIGQARAGAVPLQVGAGVARAATSSTGYISTAASAWGGAAYNSGMTTQVGGRLVTVPASWRLAANAGQVALGAVRTTPLGLAAGVAASMLLSYGIQKCVSGSIAWCVPATTEQHPNGMPYPSSSNWVWGPIDGRSGRGTTPDEACGGIASYYQSIGLNITISAVVRNTDSTYVCRLLKNGTSDVGSQPVIKSSGCAAGDTSVVSTGMCNPPGYVPAGNERATTDADWAKVPPNVMTANDALLNALGKDGVALDVQPVFDTTPQVVPLSEPYADPVTGKRYQDIATVQPNADGKTAEVQTAKQEVDASGNPVRDASGVAVKPVEQNDPCVGHETRMGCSEIGQATDTPLGEVPELYKQKYPDGISGVWRDSKPDIASTAFFQGVKSMFPTFGGGTCPVWSLSFNLGAAGNFGSVPFDVPCWIFQAVGLMMLVTATFTARKIIF